MILSGKKSQMYVLCLKFLKVPVPADGPNVARCYRSYHRHPGLDRVVRQRSRSLHLRHYQRCFSISILCILSLIDEVVITSMSCCGQVSVD